MMQCPGRLTLGLLLPLMACAQKPPADAANSAPATPVVAASPTADPVTESLTIAFVEAGAMLSPEANAQLDGAARLYRDAQPQVMIISGHSDRTGGEFENIVLSAKRAAAVKKALVDRGVPAQRLQIVAIGSAQPVPSVEPERTAVVTWR